LYGTPSWFLSSSSSAEMVSFSFLCSQGCAMGGSQRNPKFAIGGTFEVPLFYVICRRILLGEKAIVFILKKLPYVFLRLLVNLLLRNYVCYSVNYTMKAPSFLNYGSYIAQILSPLSFLWGWLGTFMVKLKI
jgi:hypothetical protein